MDHQKVMAEVSSEVLQKIRRHYPPTVKNQASKMLKEFSIVICGAPRIGKSTLINAIVGKDVAKTSAGCGACTKQIQVYPMIDEKETPFQVCIYDTPGLEEWNESITDVLDHTAPIALIFCMAPQAWTPTEKMKVLLRQCLKNKILVILVCTNMWIGTKDQYKVILAEFDKVLTELLHEKNCAFEKSEVKGITYFHEINKASNNEKYAQAIALYTAVNSKVHDHLAVHKEPSGVIELVDALTTSLDTDKVIAWFFAVLNNKGYWTQMRDEAFQAIKERAAIFGAGAFTAYKIFTSWFG